MFSKPYNTMRILICLTIIATVSCQSPKQQGKPPDQLLQDYTLQSHRTDPGSYIHMLNDLPRSPEALNQIIKCLLIHPLEARQKHIEPDEVSHDGLTPTVEKLLELLVEHGQTELSCPVEAEERLVVACYHHAMLLTSIMRNQGIPVRMRAGFSRFYEKEAGIRFGHIICEVWDRDTEGWILVDPDRNMVGLTARDFEFAHQAWHNIRKRKKNPAIYTSSVSGGIKGIINLMILDASLILKEEKLYWNLPEIVLQDIGKLKEMDRDQVAALDELSFYCASPDLMFEDISSIYRSTEAFAPSDIDYDSYFQLLMGNRK